VGCQGLLKLVMEVVVATDHMRGASAHAVDGGRIGHGLGDAGMPRQSEIVVAAEGQHGLTINGDLRPLDRLQKPALA